MVIETSRRRSTWNSNHPACTNAGVPIGIFGLTADAVRPYIDPGFTMIVAGVDTVLLGNGATALVAALRASTTLQR